MTLRKPSLNLLKTFQRAAFHGNLTRAADELCITQAAVSRQIGQLEDQLGIKVFKRSNRGIELSPEAKPLYEVLSESLSAIEQALNEISSSTTHARLSIGVDASIAENWLGQRFSSFRKLNPQLQIELQMITENKPLADADIQVIYGNGYWPGYSAKLLLQPMDFVVCSPKLLQSGPPLEKLSDLKQHSLINEFSIDVWQQWLKEVGADNIDARSGPIVHNAQMCLEMAANGEGVILTDDFVAAKHLFDGRLLKPLPHIVPNQQAIYLIFRPEQQANANVAAFMHWIKAEITQHELRAKPLRQQSTFSVTG